MAISGNFYLSWSMRASVRVILNAVRALRLEAALFLAVGARTEREREREREREIHTMLHLTHSSSLPLKIKAISPLALFPHEHFSPCEMTGLFKIATLLAPSPHFRFIRSFYFVTSHAQISLAMMIPRVMAHKFTYAFFCEFKIITLTCVLFKIMSNQCFSAIVLIIK